MNLETADRRWAGKTVIVAATGPSLEEVLPVVLAAKVPKLVINDAIHVIPEADVLYAADFKWWAFNPGLRFDHLSTEYWTTHDKFYNNKQDLKQLMPRVHVIQGMVHSGYSHDPTVLHYGHNSGFQAINLAMLFGATKIILVGFNMQRVNDRQHYFGDHPQGFVNTADYGYQRFLEAYDAALPTVPEGVDVVNCTSNSALTCFRKGELEDELKG